MSENQKEDTVSRFAKTDQKPLWSRSALSKGVSEGNEIINDEALHPLRWIENVISIPWFIGERWRNQRQVETIRNVKEAQFFKAIAILLG